MDFIEKQKMIILGSTGSIGKQTLNVCRRLNFEIEALTCSGNIELLLEQIKEFKPKKVGVADQEAATRLSELLEELDGPVPEVLGGEQGIVEIAKLKCDKLVVAIIGFSALQPLIAAIKEKRTIALANKETIVSTGKYVLNLAKQYGAKIYPIDSEPSAIWQCLAGQTDRPSKVWLTASGGPFLNYTRDQFATITIADALAHPVWSMGNKITIDSSTMLNKGLELIEICRLFDLSGDQVEVLVHPQSIIHSMVGFVDGSVIAQMGLPDMELPIQYALTYGTRRAMPDKPKLNLAELGKLTFQAPDFEKFPGLRLAYEAQAEDGAMPAVLNAANEIAVDAFVNNQISYLNIVEIVENTMKQFRSHDLLKKEDITNILKADQWARVYAEKLIEQVV